MLRITVLFTWAEETGLNIVYLQGPSPNRSRMVLLNCDDLLPALPLSCGLSDLLILSRNVSGVKWTVSLTGMSLLLFCIAELCWGTILHPQLCSSRVRTAACPMLGSPSSAPRLCRSIAGFLGDRWKAISFVTKCCLSQ